METAQFEPDPTPVTVTPASGSGVTFKWVPRSGTTLPDWCQPQPDGSFIALASGLYLVVATLEVAAHVGAPAADQRIRVAQGLNYGFTGGGGGNG